MHVRIDSIRTVRVRATTPHAAGNGVVVVYIINKVTAAREPYTQTDKHNDNNKIVFTLEGLNIGIVTAHAEIAGNYMPHYIQ